MGGLGELRGAIQSLVPGTRARGSRLWVACLKLQLGCRCQLSSAVVLAFMFMPSPSASSYLERITLNLEVVSVTVLC